MTILCIILAVLLIGVSALSVYVIRTLVTAVPTYPW